MNNDSPISPTIFSNHVDNHKECWFYSQCSFFSCFYVLGCFSLPCCGNTMSNNVTTQTIINSLKTPVGKWVILQICSLLGFICSVSVLTSCNFVNYESYGHYGIFRRELYDRIDGTYGECQRYPSSSSAVSVARSLGFLSTYFVGFVILVLLMYHWFFTKLMNQYEFFPIFKLILSPFMIACSILHLGTFSITRYSPSNKTTTQSLMSSATAAIFTFIFYFISGIMLIYIPKLSDTNQLIKMDQLLFKTHNINGNTGNKRHQNNSQDLTSVDDEESQQNQVMEYHGHECKDTRHIKTNKIDKDNLTSDKNIRRVQFNDGHNFKEDAPGNEKKTTLKYGMDSNCDNKQKVNHKGDCSNDGDSSHRYMVPDESNSSDSFHYKVPHESSRNLLDSTCSASENNYNPKSVHSGISTLTDDFEYTRKKRHQLQQHSNNMNNIDLSIPHVTAQHDVNTSRQISSLNENAMKEAGIGETIFVIGDTMVI